MKSFWQLITNKDNWSYGLFWSWNLIFLAFMTLGFAPRVLPEMILAVGTQVIPASYLLYGVVLTAIPVLAIILGLTLLRRAPGRLFALGYGVEGPLMILLAVRFFLIREATPAITVMLGIAVLGIAAFLWDLLDPKISDRRSLTQGLRLVGLTLMALTSLYAALWIAFYALPLGTMALNGLLDILRDLPEFARGVWRALVDLSTVSLVWIPFSVLGLILLLYTATLFVLMPIAVPWLSLRAWWCTFSANRVRIGWGRLALLVVLTLAVCSALFLQSNRQPQQEAFALLETPPASQEDAQALLAQQELIRSGLLNAYLAPFRYLSAVGEVVHISSIYQDVFKMTANQAARVQELYERVARPLLYQPIHPSNPALRLDNVALQQEPQEAAELYQRFFDTTIVEGERPAVVHAVRATWSRDQAEAAWQAVDDREILLASQEINIQEHGDWAEVELHEIYENQTAELQEVVYYFSLPESAVLTGVWLGDSPDRSRRFEYQVAPRGAAQAVYRNEVRRQVDPALLEQIGPRQYRLRVYPVPAMRINWDERRSNSTLEAGAPMHMWLTYQTMAADGGWPLPRLAMKRNVYWDRNTRRTLNGEPFDIDSEAWLPAAAPVAGDASPRAHRVDLPGGDTVLAEPVAEVELPALPHGLRLAAVLDRSRSMAALSEAVAANLSQLAEAAGPDAIDLYLTSSPYRGEPPFRTPLAGFDPQSIVYFGGQNAAELLAQFDELRGEDIYDAVLVFTDGSGYELGESQVQIPLPAAPVWMVHLGGDIPLGYDDDTLEAIQASGGGVTGDLEGALARLAVDLAAGGNAASGVTNVDLLDGYLWTVFPTSDAAGRTSLTNSEGVFIALAARQLILAEMERQGGKISQLETLDHLHALAQDYGIVTPYSSMIVLVNTRQQNLLDHLAEGEDRFDREFEELNDTTPSTPMPLSGVPEPHEWLLLGLAVLLLLWYASRQGLLPLRRFMD